MPELSTILTNIGLSLDIIGALMIFFGSPKISFATILHSDEENIRLGKIANRKNKLAKFGALILFVGFVMQFIAYNI